MRNLLTKLTQALCAVRGDKRVGSDDRKKLRDRLKTKKFHSLHKKLASAAAAREQKHVKKNIFVVTFDHTLSIQ